MRFAFLWRARDLPAEEPNGKRSRLQLAGRAAELRAEGRLQREIAELLGVSRSYAASLLADPDGTKDRERKKQYGGTCLTCGAATDGGNGRAKAPRYCAHHVWNDPEYRAKAVKWPRERIVAAIQEWARLFGEPPAMTDWNPWQARNAFGDEQRAARWERLRPKFPWFTSVVREFGSWNAALEEAGFSTRVANGGGGNEARRRKKESVIAPRVALAQEIANRGVLLHDIARAAYRTWGYKNPSSCYHSLWAGGLRAPHIQLTDDELARIEATP